MDEKCWNAGVITFRPLGQIPLEFVPDCGTIRKIDFMDILLYKDPYCSLFSGGE